LVARGPDILDIGASFTSPLTSVFAHISNFI